MATWSGLTRVEAWPLIRTLLSGELIDYRGHPAFIFSKHYRDQNMEHRKHTAQNLASFLRDNGIKAEVVIDSIGDGNLVFNHFSYDKDCNKKLLIKELENLCPEGEQYFKSKLSTVQYEMSIKIKDLEGKLSRKDEITNSMNEGLKLVLKKN